jgi:hypothetical protein
VKGGLGGCYSLASLGGGWGGGGAFPGIFIAHECR